MSIKEIPTIRVLVDEEYGERYFELGYFTDTGAHLISVHVALEQVDTIVVCALDDTVYDEMTDEEKEAFAIVRKHFAKE